ncbi:periplasmic heavy metal sensor, partial [Thioclava sp. BHET1]
NLAIIGIFGGLALSHGFKPPFPARDMGFGPFTGALTPADKKALFTELKTHRPELHAQRAQMRADLAQFTDTLKAAHFDAASYNAIMARLKARTVARLDLGQELLLHRLQGMSQAERAAFADRLNAELEHRRRIKRGAGSRDRGAGDRGAGDRGAGDKGAGDRGAG